MRPMLIAVFAVSLPMALSAQTPTLPRRQRLALREAASSYNQPGQFYLVAATRSPYTVIDAYASRDSADSAASRAGDLYHVYGPYTGPATADPWQVLSITVRVRTDSGERTLEYDPRKVDAVFLSTSAVRKFLIPYYTRVYGPVVADSFATMVLRVPVPICHAFSIPCTNDSLLWMPTTRY